MIPIVPDARDADFAAGYAEGLRTGDATIPTGHSIQWAIGHRTGRYQWLKEQAALVAAKKGT